YLISLIKTSGKEKNYELIEYITDVNRTYAEVLVEQNCNGAMDTAYVYGTDRLSLDRFDGSTGYYLYDPKGSVTGITNSDGQICRSYRYGASGEITYGAPQYENIYAYNGESYNPNVGSLYLRARYYNVATGAFFTEDTYLGNIREPLTLNRYVYCVGNPVNYVDPSGNIMLGNPHMPGLIRGEVNGETVFYLPNSFSDYAKTRLAQKEEENQRFMNNVEEFLLYNPIGQGIAIVNSAMLSPVTGTAVLLRDQHLANAYGETRDETADFFEVNNNLLVGVAGSFHGTYQLLSDPAYLIYGAAYVLDDPNGTIFRDPLERPLAMVDAFWEGDNKGSVRYAGQTLGYMAQIALAMQAVKSCKNQKVPNRDNKTIDDIATEGQKALDDFDVSSAYVKPKHLSTSGGNGAKFLGDTKEMAEAILQAAIKDGTVQSIADNGLTNFGQQSYQIIIDAGKTVGTRGETLIKIVISEDGGMLSAYPVK
ncbi:MAG: RHS repeat-associated core domain-containing protein, partial [Lachnospiraceae bacterium]|nr:RHS repeat-associated core domain-containing protein [Lachnospiraceae bacterium]